MKIIELTNPDREEYNNFVAAEQGGSFLQSWEWGDWQSFLGRQVKRLKVQSEGGQTAAVVQLVKMPIVGGRYYWYASYGPVASKEQAIDSAKLIAALASKFTDAVFVRVEPKYPIDQKLGTKTKNIQPSKTLLVDLSKSQEELLVQMHAKTRYNIKVAQKHGVEIKDEFDISIGNGLFFDEALKLIMETSKRQKFNTFAADYYKKIIDFFAVQNRGDLKLHIYKAIFQNQLLATAIIVDFGKTRTFLFGGSSEFHKNVMAPYLLHFQAMLDAKASGFAFYDFWGIETSSGETPGFVRFKLGFGGEPKEYAGAYDIVNKRIYYKLYLVLRFVNNVKRKISG